MRPISDDPVTATAGITRMDGPQAAAPAAIDGAEAAEAAEAASPALPVSASEALAAAVASGALDPTTAAERLIAATVAAGRPVDVTPEVWAAVEREVSALLAGDPALADLLAPL